MKGLDLVKGLRHVCGNENRNAKSESFTYPVGIGIFLYRSYKSASIKSVSILSCVLYIMKKPYFFTPIVLRNPLSSRLVSLDFHSMIHCNKSQDASSFRKLLLYRYRQIGLNIKYNIFRS